jgi:hypothetical protein
MEATMMFIDCSARQDHDGALRCGLPAEMTGRFTMRSTDGPVEAAMIRCPAGHYFCGAIESLTWDRTDKHDPGPAAMTSRAGRDSRQRGLAMLVTISANVTATDTSPTPRQPLSTAIASPC